MLYPSLSSPDSWPAWPVCGLVVVRNPFQLKMMGAVHDAWFYALLRSGQVRSQLPVLENCSSVVRYSASDHGCVPANQWRTGHVELGSYGFDTSPACDESRPMRPGD